MQNLIEPNFFRARRKALGMSMGDIVFALRPLRITVSAISGWERGQVPSIDLVDDIARVYQVPVRKVLDAMHEMARARTRNAAAEPVAATE